MKKQTAVEWLVNQCNNWSAICNGEFIDPDVIAQAKAMEKEQLLHAFEFPDASIGWDFEKYLNETYNTDTP